MAAASFSFKNGIGMVAARRASVLHSADRQSADGSVAVARVAGMNSSRQLADMLVREHRFEIACNAMFYFLEWKRLSNRTGQNEIKRYKKKHVESACRHRLNEDRSLTLRSNLHHGF